MNGAQHTPGPWIAEEGTVWGGCNAELEGSYRLGTPILNPDMRYRRWGRDVSPAEREANLCVAAAAPDLLEALEALIVFAEDAETKMLVGDEGCLWPVEFARVAIAKARGLPVMHTDGSAK